MASAATNNGMFNNENEKPSSQKDERPVVCVFCGSKSGSSPIHLEAARELAHALHKNNYKLVYGGGTVGVMGEIAKTLVSLSGPDAVTGIIPEALLNEERKNLANGSNIDSEDVMAKISYGAVVPVNDMHTRKDLMAKAVRRGGPGSGFVALTGGFGTMEELMEMTTWNQLGIQASAVVVYNVEGFWDGLFKWVEKAVESGFITQKNKGIIVEATSGEEVVEKLINYVPSQDRMDLNWDQK